METGEIVRGWKRRVDKPSYVVSTDFDELWNRVMNIERNLSALIDRVEWLRGQGKVGTVWVIEKDKPSNQTAAVISNE